MTTPRTYIEDEDGAPMGELAVLSWDWREQPSIDRLAGIVRDLSGGTVHIHNVGDTGSDQYAIVVSTMPLVQDQVKQAYLDWWEAGQ